MNRILQILAVWILLAGSLFATAVPKDGDLTATRWNRVRDMAQIACEKSRNVEARPSRAKGPKTLPLYVPRLAGLTGGKSKLGEPVLIIGDEPLDESLTITADETVQGDILVMNQGVLVVDGATLHLAGNIVLVGDGTFQMMDGTLAFQSTYRYQHAINGAQNSAVILSGTQVTSNGYNLEAGFSDNATFTVTDTEFEAGLTTALFGNASAGVVRSNPLEWVLDESSRLSITDDDGPFIFWPVFPEGSVADLTFPDGEAVTSFEISADDPDISGLDLRMTLENLSHVWWGLMLRSGADVTVRDSVMRTTGFILDQGEESAITGLVNGQTYTDAEIPVEGLRYRLVNTRVDTWNVYGWGTANLEMNNCLFGELGMLDGTDAALTNCMIDGTGGYLFTGSDTETLLVFTALTSDTIANDQSIQVFAYSSIINGDIIATNQSILLLLNTVTERVPQARDGALAVDLNIAPPPAPSINQLLPLEGTAFMAAGPAFGVSLDYWQLFYGEGDGSGGWTPITGPETALKRNEMLAAWDTRGLASGAYTLRLSMTLEGGFSVDTTRSIYLGSNPEAEDRIVHLPHVDWSSQWQSWLVVDNLGPDGESADLYLYAGGELIRSESMEVAAGDQVRIPLLEGETGVAAGGMGLRFREIFLNNVDAGMAEFLLDGAAGSTRHFLMPHYQADVLTWMGLAVMNPGSKGVSGMARAVGPAGEMIADTALELDPMSRKAFLLADLFGDIDITGVARVDLEMDSPVTGLTISGAGNEKLLFTPAIGQPALDEVNVPHIADNGSSWENQLVLDNTGDQPATVQLVLYSGGIQVVAETLDLDAGATRMIDLNIYAGLDPVMGRLTGDGSAVAVRLSYRSTDQGGMAEFILDGVSGRTLEFLLPGQFTDMVNWMGLAIANSDTKMADLMLTAWKNGEPVATKSLPIGSQDRLADGIQGFFAAISTMDIDRVTVATDTGLLSGLTISGFDQERLLFTPALVTEPAD